MTINIHSQRCRLVKLLSVVLILFLKSQRVTVHRHKSRKELPHSQTFTVRNSPSNSGQSVGDFTNLSGRSTLLTTSERLGAVAAYDTLSAAHEVSNLHNPFMRATAAIAPNRQL